MQHLILSSFTALLMTVQVFAQQVNNNTLEPKLINTYKEIHRKLGQNGRYTAARETLRKYPKSKSAYKSKLYTLLAEEAVLSQNWPEAKKYYKRTLKDSFIVSSASLSALLSQNQVTAASGLRAIAKTEQKFERAIYYHQKHDSLLAVDWPNKKQSQQMNNDYILAQIYQEKGSSEEALKLLLPYAFGIVNGFQSSIDKKLIERLSFMLVCKYGQKPMRVFLKEAHFLISFDEKENKFYLKIYQNKAYFERNQHNFAAGIKEEPNSAIEANRYFGDKFRNSPFYEQLSKYAKMPKRQFKKRTKRQNGIKK